MSRRDARRDRDLAALLSARAFTEIRYLAGHVRGNPGDLSAEEVLDRIRFLANLCHNLPGASRPRRHRPARKGAPPSLREQALTDRPMSWTWNTAGPEGQAWMLRHIEEAGRAWTPPPPIPVHLKGPRPITLRQRADVLLTRWPGDAPPGREPLPANAHVLKALDTDTICALYEEAGRLRLGLGKGGPWLRAHLARDAVHYLVPDPASYYWPGNTDGRGSKIRWWQCTALLRMHDGEQVSNMIAVMPETFTALPSTLARREQVRLFNLARNTKRDTYLWGRDHKAECSPDQCGYIPEPQPPAEEASAMNRASTAETADE